MPKNWNKMSLLEQEEWAANKLQEIFNIEDEYRKLLGKIRGGQRVQIKEDDRPDLIALKGE